MPKTLKRPVVSQLAKDTFRALAPYINVKDPGEKLPDGKGGVQPEHIITKEMWELLGRHRNGEKSLFYKESGCAFQPWHIFANYTSAKHVQGMIFGNSTTYYTGGKSGKTIVTLDVDAHTGEPDQLASIELVRKFLGPQHVMHRPSARGENGIIKLSYDHFAPSAVNRALKDFETAWKRYQRASDLLCTVEIKGTITTRDKSGSLAKLPCGKGWTAQNLDEFDRLPEVTLGWLKGATAAMNERSERLEREKPEPAQVVVQAPKSRLRAGSTTGFPLNQEELDAIPQALLDYRQIAYHCMAYHEAPKSKGKKLVFTDFTQSLIVLSICAKHPNSDGSNPHNRIQAIWNTLYSDGLFERAFDNSRWAAIRNTLTDLNYLEVEDDRYWWFDNLEKKGQAMKWCLKTEFCYDFEAVQSGTTSEDELTNIFSRAYSPPTHDYVQERWRPTLKDPKRSMFDDPGLEERLLAVLQF